MRGIELTTDELARPPALGSKKKKRRKHSITANLSGTRYEVGESGVAAAAAMPVNSQAEFCLGAPVIALKLRECTSEVYTLIMSGPDLGFLCDTAIKITEHLVFFCCCDFVIIDRFYIALFSALEQTHCTHMGFYMSE